MVSKREDFGLVTLWRERGRNSSILKQNARQDKRKMAKKSMWMALFALLAVLMTVMTAVATAEAPSASASHILVPTEAEIDQLLVELEAADDLEAKFAELAKAKSKCPSGRGGGALGTFGRGQMVQEFDTVVFEKPVGVVHKVKTQASLCS